MIVNETMTIYSPFVSLYVFHYLMLSSNLFQIELTKNREEYKQIFCHPTQ